MPKPNKSPDPEALVAMVESIRVFNADHEDSFAKDNQRLVESLPSKTHIIYEMDDAQRDVLYRSVKHLWVAMTGNPPEFESENKDAKDLDGAYWMLPGGVLIGGYNHFQSIKENKLLICSMLDINPLVLEKLMASGNTGEVIVLVVSRGGVRTLIDRDKSEVIMQTSEASWPWVKEKLERMYHKTKMAKILDLSKPYEGWKSGVSVVVH